MVTQTTMVFTAGGMVAMLLWLTALVLYAREALCPKVTPAQFISTEILSRAGMLLAAAGWGAYAMTTWPQPSWRLILLPPLALIALLVKMGLARRGGVLLLVLCLYGYAVTAYGTALATLWVGNTEPAPDLTIASLLAATRDAVAGAASGTCIAYGAFLLITRRCRPEEHPDPLLAERLGEGMVRVALIAATLALGTAAWRTWSMWGEVARIDVTTLFITWSFLMAASLRQMTTGMVLTRTVNTLVLLSLASLIIMVIAVP